MTMDGDKVTTNFAILLVQTKSLPANCFPLIQSESTKPIAAGGRPQRVISRLITAVSSDMTLILVLLSITFSRGLTASGLSQLPDKTNSSNETSSSKNHTNIAFNLDVDSRPLAEVNVIQLYVVPSQRKRLRAFDHLPGCPNDAIQFIKTANFDSSLRRHVFRTAFASSAEECANLCHTHFFCRSAGYEPSGSRCRLSYKRSVANCDWSSNSSQSSNPKDDLSSTDWWLRGKGEDENEEEDETVDVWLDCDRCARPSKHRANATNVTLTHELEANVTLANISISSNQSNVINQSNALINQSSVINQSNVVINQSNTISSNLSNSNASLPSNLASTPDAEPNGPYLYNISIFINESHQNQTEIAKLRRQKISTNSTRDEADLKNLTLVNETKTHANETGISSRNATHSNETDFGSRNASHHGNNTLSTKHGNDTLAANATVAPIRATTQDFGQFLATALVNWILNDPGVNFTRAPQNRSNVTNGDHIWSVGRNESSSSLNHNESSPNASSSVHVNATSPTPNVDSNLNSSKVLANDDPHVIANLTSHNASQSSNWTLEHWNSTLDNSSHINSSLINSTVHVNASAQNSSGNASISIQQILDHSNFSGNSSTESFARLDSTWANSSHPSSTWENSTFHLNLTNENISHPNSTAPGSNLTAPGSNSTAPGSNSTAPGSNSTVQGSNFTLQIVSHSNFTVQNVSHANLTLQNVTHENSSSQNVQANSSHTAENAQTNLTGNASWSTQNASNANLSFGSIHVNGSLASVHSNLSENVSHANWTLEDASLQSNQTWNNSLAQSIIKILHGNASVENGTHSIPNASNEYSNASHANATDERILASLAVGHPSVHVANTTHLPESNSTSAASTNSTSDVRKARKFTRRPFAHQTGIAGNSSTPTSFVRGSVEES